LAADTCTDSEDGESKDPDSRVGEETEREILLLILGDA
jgi:hypothetical protein